MNDVLIGLGSNVGDRMAWLQFARRRIAELPATTVTAASSVFETEPVGGPPQDLYLNACLAVRTELGPLDLLDALLSIEREAGRVREGTDTPRTLDLDLLLYGSREIADRRLSVPHPRFVRRAFALVPASEIAPEWRMPPGNDTIAALAAQAPAAGVRRHAGEKEWA